MSWWDLRIIDKAGVFHIHHQGDKASARERARSMAERKFPKEDGYRLKWSSDCVMIFKHKKHIADVAVEPLSPRDEVDKDEAIETTIAAKAKAALHE